MVALSHEIFSITVGSIWHVSSKWMALPIGCFLSAWVKVKLFVDDFDEGRPHGTSPVCTYVVIPVPEGLVKLIFHWCSLKRKGRSKGKAARSVPALGTSNEGAHKWGSQLQRCPIPRMVLPAKLQREGCWDICMQPLFPWPDFTDLYSAGKKRIKVLLQQLPELLYLPSNVHCLTYSGKQLWILGAKMMVEGCACIGTRAWWMTHSCCANHVGLESWNW